MSTTQLLPLIRQRFFDSNGQPLSGGKLYSYIANTVTPYATYTDASGLTPNTNPIILDSNGYCDVWLGSGSYKFVLADSSDVVQWTRDNISTTIDQTTASPWTTFAITDGMSATDLTGAVVDLTKYSSATFALEITRGTTVIANGHLAIQNLNGTPQIGLGNFISTAASGVTFSIATVSSTVQLRAATSSGPGAGKIKLSRTLIPI